MTKEQKAQFELEKHGGHYLYKITCTQTGHFYYGATSDWEKRSGVHMSKIVDLIGALRWHDKKYPRRKIKPPFKPTKPALKVNLFLAEHIKPKIQKIINPARVVTKYYSFKVIARSELAIDIKKLENDELKNNIGNPLCLNCAFYSSYNDTRYSKTRKRINDVYNMYFKNGVRIQ